MMWNMIGCSVAGTHHIAAEKPCEDALNWRLCNYKGGDALICAVSDGAGSAANAAMASAYTVQQVIALLESHLASSGAINEAGIYEVAEEVQQGIMQMAEEAGTNISDFYSTLAGAIVTDSQAAFFQVGDGAIAIENGTGQLRPVWLPEFGEFYNVTDFIGAEDGVARMKVAVLETNINELAIFTDGIQLLAINFEQQSIHQPFFTGFFHHLRQATTQEQLGYLQTQLKHYLSSEAINNRTDDDKTLFLATRIKPSLQ